MALILQAQILMGPVMPPRKPSSANPSAPGPSAAGEGFNEAAAVFAQPSADEQRFSESVALMRVFNLIEGTASRQQVIDLARRLAGGASN